MRGLALSLLAVVVLGSGTCRANEFFEGLVGRWKEVSETTVAAGNWTFSNEDLVTFRLFKNGTLYAESKSLSDGQISKSWLYPRGTLRGISYIDGVKQDAESVGTWRIREGKLFLSVRIELDGAVVARMDVEIRRVHRNKYVSESTSPDGSYSTATMTRVRN
jgi:hypothetical protein